MMAIINMMSMTMGNPLGRARLPCITLNPKARASEDPVLSRISHSSNIIVVIIIILVVMIIRFQYNQNIPADTMYPGSAMLLKIERPRLFLSVHDLGAALPPSQNPKYPNAMHHRAAPCISRLKPGGVHGLAISRPWPWKVMSESSAHCHVIVLNQAQLALVRHLFCRSDPWNHGTPWAAGGGALTV